MKNQANRKLISNTVFLYLMTTSIQILNLLTVPYLSRVLGPTEYGQIGLALGYMAYVQIILDLRCMQQRKSAKIKPTNVKLSTLLLLSLS